MIPIIILMYSLPVVIILYDILILFTLIILQHSLLSTMSLIIYFKISGHVSCKSENRRSKTRTGMSKLFLRRKSLANIPVTYVQFQPQQLQRKTLENTASFLRLLNLLIPSSNIATGSSIL